MNADQTRRLGMYRNAASVLSRVPPSDVPAALPATFARFHALILRIDELAAKQALRTEGPTTLCKNAFAAMTNATVAICSLAGAFAHAHRLQGLIDKTTITPRSFNRGPMVLRPACAQACHDAVLAHLPQLAACGITAELLADWQAKIDAAREAFTQPLRVAIAKTVATKTLVETFREADALLTHQIDRLAFVLRTSHPDLHAEYQAARRTSRRPHHRPVADEKPAQPPATRSINDALAA